MIDDADRSIYVKIGPENVGGGIPHYKLGTPCLDPGCLTVHWLLSPVISCGDTHHLPVEMSSLEIFALCRASSTTESITFGLLRDLLPFRSHLINLYI